MPARHPLPRPAALALAALLLPVVAPRLHAQRLGTVEVGGFAQWTGAASPLALRDGVGAGGRLGLWATQRWQLEGDFTLTRLAARAPREAGTRVLLRTQAARINYNVPFEAHGMVHEFFAGVGPLRIDVGGKGREGISGIGGVRLLVGRWTAVRAEGGVDWTPRRDETRLGADAGYRRFANRFVRVGASVVADLLP